MFEWLSSWLAEQEVRGSIPGLATWISVIGYLLLPSRDMAEIPLSDVNPQYNQPTNQTLCNSPIQMENSTLNREYCAPICTLMKDCGYQSLKFGSIILTFLAHRSRRLEWAIVIAHRPSSVRLSSSSSSVRKLFTFSTSSPKPLDGFWWNLVGMKYLWSLTSVVIFRPDPPRGRSRAGPK